MSRDGINSDIFRIAESLVAEYSGLTPEVIIRIRQICADKGLSQSETDTLLSELGGQPREIDVTPAIQQPFHRSSSSFAHSNSGYSNQASSLNAPDTTDSFSGSSADPGETFLIG